MPPQHCIFNFKNLSHHISMHRLYPVYIPHTFPTTFLCTGCTQCTYHIHFPPHFYAQVIPSVHTTYNSHHISMYRLHPVYIPHTFPTTFLSTGCTQCTYHKHFPPHFYLQVVPSVHTTYISHHISIYRLYPVYIPHTFPTTFLSTGCTQCTYQYHKTAFKNRHCLQATVKHICHTAQRAMVLNEADF